MPGGLGIETLGCVLFISALVVEGSPRQGYRPPFYADPNHTDQLNRIQYTIYSLRKKIRELLIRTLALIDKCIEFAITLQSPLCHRFFIEKQDELR